MAPHNQPAARSLDDSTVIDQIEAYRRAKAVGHPVDRNQLLQQFPEIASQLNACLAALDAVDQLASDVRQMVTPLGALGDRQLNEPHVLGDFRLVREIGHGGMGVVYEAEQISLGRRVAVKILPFASLWSETAIHRFQQEVRLAAMLEHPHIVPIYAVGCERDIHFYAMKLIDGRSLADVIRRRQSSAAQPGLSSPIGPIGPMGPISPDALTYAEWGRSAASALSFAHQRGVIHRDIKPSNLLLDRQGRLYIADFGLARSGSDPNLTRTGDLLGTPRYMSPEQASGTAKLVDERTDIYGLGATLYELLTLQPVVRAAGRAAAIRELQDLQVIAPRTIDPTIPRPLEQIVLKCLQADPVDRYASAAELVEDLDRYLAGQPVLARSPGIVRRTSRWLQRHPQMTLAAMVALIAISLISTFSFWMSQHGWLGSAGQRGPPTTELAALNSSSSNPPDFLSPQESPDMLRKSPTNITTKATGKRRPIVEQLEPRTLLAQLAFGTPLNLGSGVNSSNGELGATVTADGLSLMFHRYTSSNVFLGIFEATRNSTTQTFGTATSAGSGVNSVAAPSTPDISADGLALLFSDDGEGGISAGNGTGLYEATRSQRSEPFSNVHSLGNLLPNQRCNGPSLSADGLTLFFTAFDTSNIQNDIYQATRLSTSDPWGNVIKLGPEINTPVYNDAQPSISSDGLKLFFNSTRPGGFGEQDLYVSIRSSVNAPWGNAVNLGPQVNTPYIEQAPFISVDGSTLYFHSTRPGGLGGEDLYQVPILGTTGETKFYVVDDASTDRTYEYQADGIAIEGYALTSGNSGPRGAASTVAGDKVWVVDASRRVYVYNTAGGSLGSWSAGSLNAAAQVEGIATNGTDIWIVDAKQDKVYKYTGAASRTENSQNAANSFNLNSGNGNPKDIVTDGTYLYVVNDSTSDKVFKYTLNGNLVSSWTVSTPDATSPTGITLDPTNPAHLWIVDNGTDRVYQYSNAVNQANGSSKLADASFSLATAAGNTNPQGIADPPVPGGGWESVSSGNLAFEAQLLNVAWVPPLPPSPTTRDTLFGHLASTLDEPTDLAWIDDLVESLQPEFQPQASQSLTSQTPVDSRSIEVARVFERESRADIDEAIILLDDLLSADLLP